ncbi:hypothetical protein [Halorussus salinisoli]|uniref:hypothetical protein n=1 Tax=Halorussus salinisoli TaxID=2558242 RepID=UPI0010C245D0|nr:hypothetical protein [Halorussus salinisoli]
MKRRRFIVGLGGLAAGAGVTLGTGAFTSTSANRRLEVQTADDNEALLALTQLGDGKRSIEDDTPEKVEFSLPGLEERLDDPDLGLGTDSVYEFDRDADESEQSEPVEGLLRIENRGTQPVEVYSEHETDSELEVELYDVDDPDETALRDDPATLGVGDSVDVGFRVRTFGASVDTFDETLTIVAEALTT